MPEPFGQRLLAMRLVGKLRRLRDGSCNSREKESARRQEYLCLAFQERSTEFRSALFFRPEASSRPNPSAPNRPTCFCRPSCASAEPGQGIEQDRSMGHWHLYRETQRRMLRCCDTVRVASCAGRESLGGSCFKNMRKLLGHSELVAGAAISSVRPQVRSRISALDVKANRQVRDPAQRRWPVG